MAQRYTVHIPRPFKDQDNNEKTDFIRVGVAFPHREKDGFNLELYALPVGARAPLKLVLLPADSDQQQSSGRNTQRDSGRGSNQNRQDSRGPRR